MNFKDRAIAFQEEREDIEDIINKGIRKFNNVNNARVDDIYYPDSGWSDQATQYECLNSGIKITWFEDVGRCGGTDYETYMKTIPYEYFEEDEDLDAINADVEKRKSHAYRLSNARSHKSTLNSEKYNLEKEIRELKSFSNKYSMNVDDKIKDIEASLVITKSNIDKQSALIASIEKEI